MGLALMLLIWLITLASTYFFVAKTWWLPVGASAAAGWIDHQFALTFIIMGIVFLAAQLWLGYIVWRYRETPIVSAGGLFARKHDAGNRLDGADRGAVHRVESDGQQRVGEPAFRCRRGGRGAGGSDGDAVCLVLPLSRAGRKVRRRPVRSLMDPSAGGEAAVGLNTSDPAAKDDVVTGTMYLPVDREVDVSLRAVDVIHSFFVPSLRFKQDTVPGLNIHMHFKPTAIGEYEIACAELCGLGHYKMHGMVHVVSQEDFDKWLAAREAEKQ